MNDANSAASRRRFDPWLTAIVVLAAVCGALIVGRAKNWAVMPDELIYVELSRSIVRSVLPIPAFHGGFVYVYQLLFPLLLAPLLALVSMPTAYPLIAILNACLIASTAIPTYLLANYITQNRAAARWAALCCVITPWLIFASRVLPDALAYAASTWAVYAIARTASGGQRALKGDLLTLLAILVAFLVRNQFLLLLGVWAGAVVCARAASAYAESGMRAVPARLLDLLRSRPLPIFTLFAVFLMLQVKPAWVLGLYTAVSTTGSNALPNEGILHELVQHAGSLTLGVAALPMILGLPWIVSALGRVKERAQFDGAIVIALASVAVIYVAASFDMRFDPTDRVIERYIFYLAPLWFVAMAALFAKPPTNLVAFALPALIGVLAAIMTSPYGLDTAINRLTNSVFSPTQVVLIGWQSVAGSLGTSISGLIVVLALLICGFCWWAFTAGRAALAQNVCFSLLALVLIGGTLSTVPDIVRAQNAAATHVFGARDAAQKRWIEIATGNGNYAVAYSYNSLRERGLGNITIEDKAAWRDVVFWNRGLIALYAPLRSAAGLSTPLPGKIDPGLPDWQTGSLPRAEGDDSSYLLLASSDPRFAPVSITPPLRKAGFALFRTGPGERRAAWAIKGLTWSGWVPPAGATMRVWAPQGAKSPVTFAATLRLRGPGKRQRLTKRTIRVSPGGSSDLQIERGAHPMRLVQVRLSELRDSSGTSR